MISDEILIEIFLIILYRMRELSSIFFNFKGSPVSDKSIVILFERYIRKINSLEGFFLNLSSTKITSRSIKSLANNTRKFMETLINYQMYLSQNELTDDDIIPLFCSMPQCKSLQFSLGKTSITDKTIKAFISTLSTMKSLEILELHFWQIEMKMESVIELFQNIKEVRKFYLNLRGVEINDSVIKEFERVSVHQMKELEEAFLYLDKGISQDGIALLNRIHLDYPYKD